MMKEGDMKKLPTTFAEPGSAREFEVRGPFRMSCTSVAIKEPGREPVLCSTYTEDNVPMAMAVLGTGRFDADMETRAAEIVAGLDTASNEADLVDRALVQLRAVMLLREKQEAERVAAKQAEADKLLADAYTLYLLGMPEGGDVLESVEAFRGTQESRVWGNRLVQLRRGIAGGF